MTLFADAPPRRKAARKAPGAKLETERGARGREGIAVAGGRGGRKATARGRASATRRACARVGRVCPPRVARGRVTPKRDISGVRLRFFTPLQRRRTSRRSASRSPDATPRSRGSRPRDANLRLSHRRSSSRLSSSRLPRRGGAEGRPLPRALAQARAGWTAAVHSSAVDASGSRGAPILDRPAGARSSRRVRRPVPLALGRDARLLLLRLPRGAVAASAGTRRARRTARTVLCAPRRARTGRALQRPRVLPRCVSPHPPAPSEDAPLRDRARARAESTSPRAAAAPDRRATTGPSPPEAPPKPRPKPPPPARPAPATPSPPPSPRQPSPRKKNSNSITGRWILEARTRSVRERTADVVCHACGSNSSPRSNARSSPPTGSPPTASATHGRPCFRRLLTLRGSSRRDRRSSRFR